MKGHRRHESHVLRTGRCLVEVGEMKKQKPGNIMVSGTPHSQAALVRSTFLASCEIVAEDFSVALGAH